MSTVCVFPYSIPGILEMFLEHNINQVHLKKNNKKPIHFEQKEESSQKWDKTKFFYSKFCLMVVKLQTSRRPLPELI